jgi:hypothetical protein
VLVVTDTVTGVVVTPGAVRIARRGVLRGLVLSGGDLIVDAGGRLAGAAATAGSVEVAPGAEVVVDPCRALAALASRPALRRPLPLPGAGGFTP